MAKKDLSRTYTREGLRRRVQNHFGVGDIVDVADGHCTVRAKIVGMYPNIVRYRDVETGTYFSLTLPDAVNVVMVRRVSSIS